MTLDFYDLKEEPFGFLPDSRFLYLSSTHRQALATLLKALQAGRSFVTLVAQPYMGKTTLLFQTLHSLGDQVATVYLFQAPRTPVELLRAVLTDLGVRQIDETAEGMCSQLKQVLLESHRLGKRVIVVIDEAQNLDTSILDLVCTLPNLATIGVKLIQFILCGQPLLADKLAAIKPIQLTERGAAAHLEPFSVQDTAQYVDHRLRTAGYSRQSPLFTPEAAALVAHYSQGTPRIINHLCFEALSAAYRHRQQQIGADTVHEAAKTLDLVQPKQKTMVPAPVAAQESVRRTSPALPPAGDLPRLSAPKIPDVPKVLSGPVVGPVPAPPAATAPQERKISAKESVRAIAKRAAIHLSLMARQTSQARLSPFAVGSLVWRPLPRLTIAAALTLSVSGAIFGMYRTQTVHPGGKESIAASPLPTASRPLAQRGPIMAVKGHTAPKDMKAALASPAAMDDIKGMDLQTALRALATRKQRQQQDQTADAAQSK